MLLARFMKEDFDNWYWAVLSTNSSPEDAVPLYDDIPCYPSKLQVLLSNTHWKLRLSWCSAPAMRITGTKSNAEPFYKDEL